MSVYKNVLLPFAQPPFHFKGYESYPNLTGVFADLAKKWGLKVYTEQDLIADLFNVPIVDVWSDAYIDKLDRERDSGNLLLIFEIDEQEEELDSRETCLHRALVSSNLLTREEGLITGICADIVVPMNRWQEVALKKDEVVKILRQEFQKRIDETKHLYEVKTFVYDASDRKVCIYKGDNRDEVWAAASKDYSQQGA